MAESQFDREPLKCLGNNFEDSVNRNSTDIEDLPKKRKCSPMKVRKRKRVLKLTNFFPRVDKEMLNPVVPNCGVSACPTNSNLKENVEFTERLKTDEPKERKLETHNNAVSTNLSDFGSKEQTDSVKFNDNVRVKEHVDVTDRTLPDRLLVSERNKNTQSFCMGALEVMREVAFQDRTAVLFPNPEKSKNSKCELYSEVPEMKRGGTCLGKTSPLLTNPERKVNSDCKVKQEQSCRDKASILLPYSERRDISRCEVWLEASEAVEGEPCLVKSSVVPEKSCELKFSTKDALSAFTPCSAEKELKKEIAIKELIAQELKEAEPCASKDSVNISEALSSFQDNKLDLFFDDWPIDEIIENTESCSTLCLSEWQRCEVISVSEDASNESKVLHLRSVESRDGAKCQLQGIWRSCEVNVGDLVSTKAKLSDESVGMWVINNDVGFLVLLPDVLLTPTAVVGSISCTRQGVLNYLFSKPDVEEKPKVMVVGSLIHGMLQQILTQGDYSPECIAAIVEDVISSAPSVRLLYSCRMSLKEARSELLQIVPSIQRFCSLYELSGPGEHPKEKECHSESWQGTIRSVLAVEDNYCIPQLGLKGKVDVTVMAQEQGQDCARLMPLEVKTGQAKNSVEHRGQVILYCLMASQVSPDVDGGLLVYLREGFARKVQVGRPEQRDIILLRNQLARYVIPPRAVAEHDQDQGKDLSLPNPVSSTRVCKWCPHLTTCAAFDRADRAEKKPMSPAEDFRSKCIEHLTPQHTDYVIHWTNLLWLEASESKSSDSTSDLWCVSPAERVKRGRCLVDLSLEPHVSYMGLDSYHHVLRQKAVGEARESCQLCSGELVVLSTWQRVAVAIGFIVHIDTDTVTLDLSRDLTCDITLIDEQYIVDAYEVQSNIRSSLGNLAALLDNTTIAGRLRQFVIDRVAPAFDPAPVGSLQLLSGSSFQLNSSQLHVVFKALSARDYLLVKGLPGCGKSTTVAALVKLLVMQDRSVLVTAHTHSAVDTVLQKLVQLEVPFLRLGTASRVHPTVRPWTELQLTRGCTSPEQLDKAYKSKLVVATTCMGMRHPLFATHSFDVCIVDESTQVLQPVVLGPLLRSHKFILVGDPDQLPPATRSKTASLKGLTKCLLTHLDSPEATVSLDLQYRMNQRISDLANHLTYGGRLKCGSPAVANATLQLAPDKISECFWMQRSLSCMMEDSVVFINVPGTQQDKKACTNVKEAGVVQELVKALLQMGMSCDSIGVMSPYRDQVAYLRGALKDSASTVETNTVDQYQGRDKDVIIFCCTNNWILPSSMQDPGGILSDQRRLTVAVTRARHKLIIVGNSVTLQAFAPIRCILEFIGDEKILQFDS